MEDAAKSDDVTGTKPCNLFDATRLVVVPPLGAVGSFSVSSSLSLSWMSSSVKGFLTGSKHGKSP